MYHIKFYSEIVNNCDIDKLGNNNFTKKFDILYIVSVCLVIILYTTLRCIYILYQISLPSIVDILIKYS